jgi:HSP20 family protein
MAKSNKVAKKDSSAPAVSSLFGNDAHSLFDEFARHMGAWPMYRRAFDWDPMRQVEKASGMLVPEIDATETDNEMRVTAELPGMEEKDIDVQLSGDLLTIRGEKREEKTSDEENRHVSERRYGSFQRTLRVPDSVDSEKISAAVKNGVLTVVMPKSAVAKEKQRKIPIGKS